MALDMASDTLSDITYFIRLRISSANYHSITSTIEVLPKILSGCMPITAV